LAEGRVLIDCGANIGYWSVRHQDFGFVDSIAIEANPRLIPFLRRNYDGPVHHAAVHSCSGQELLFSGDGALGHVAASGIAVPTLALGDLEIRAPVLVKLDVEGAEIEAIEGLGQLDAVIVYEEQVSADLGKGVPRNLVAMR
jgi:FkbM family methyltransferase